MAESAPADNPPGQPSNRSKGLGLLVIMLFFFVVLFVSLLFNDVSATADPMHWESVFASFFSIFTCFASAGIAGGYLRNKPFVLGRARYYLVAGIIISASIFTGGAYVSSPHTWPLPWAFQGAYADYSGNGTLLNGSPFVATTVITALTANGQNVHLQYNQSITVGGVPTFESNDTWVSATVSPETVGAISRIYNANLTLDEKTVATVVYVYQPDVSGNRTLTTTIYDSKSIQFPIELEVTINSNSINEFLVSTNIPGLMP